MSGPLEEVRVFTPKLGGMPWHKVGGVRTAAAALVGELRFIGITVRRLDFVEYDGSKAPSDVGGTGPYQVGGMAAVLILPPWTAETLAKVAAASTAMVAIVRSYPAFVRFGSAFDAKACAGRIVSVCQAPRRRPVAEQLVELFMQKGVRDRIREVHGL